MQIRERERERGGEKDTEREREGEGIEREGSYFLILGRKLPTDNLHVAFA